jgi:hypothetical protein
MHDGLRVGLDEQASGALVPGATVVCTLGMHRSGTSVVSRIVNLLGVDLGPERIVSVSGVDNPRGYWEHSSMRVLNDEILGTFGGEWHVPPYFPPAWIRDPRLDDVRVRAGEFLTQTFAAQPVWGWKDPRSCLTLPFWQDLVGEMRYVICVRNPCAIAESLLRRNGLHFLEAEQLWLAYTQAALAHTASHRRLLVFYEDLLDDCRPQLRRLAAFLDHPERAEEPRVQAAVAGFIDRELWHHRHRPESVTASPRLSLATKSLYSLVRDSRAQADTIRTLAAERDRLSTQVVAAAEGASAHVLEHTATMEHLTRQRNALSRHRDDLARERQDWDRERHALAMTIHAIHHSRTWRLATAARTLLAIPLPYGTRRRAVAAQVVRAVIRRVTGARSASPPVTLEADS